MTISLAIVLLPHLLGMRFVITQDDAMAPSYPNGSLIFVRSEDSEEILVGDVITYYVNQGEKIKTRRVVAKEGEEIFYTKGDASEQMELGLVSSRNLIGQPVLHFPYIGHFFSRRVVNIAIFVFWVFAGFLTFITIWMMVEQFPSKARRTKIRSDSSEKIF